jgi:hypothetical protein
MDPLEKALHVLKTRKEPTPYISVPNSMLNRIMDLPALTEFQWYSAAGLGWKAQSTVTKLSMQLGCDEDQFCLVDMRDPKQKKKLDNYTGGEICFVVVDKDVSGEEYPRVS